MYLPFACSESQKENPDSKGELLGFLKRPEIRRETDDHVHLAQLYTFLQVRRHGIFFIEDQFSLK